jgi:hypothetical protein
MPSPLSSRMVCSTSRAMTGASPSEGSSNIISSGAPIRQPDRKHLLLAAGERARRLLRALGKPWKHRQHALAIRGAVGAGTRQHGADVEIFRNRERRKNLPPLGHLAEAKIADAVTGPARNVGAAESRTCRSLHAPLDPRP